MQVVRAPRSLVKRSLNKPGLLFAHHFHDHAFISLSVELRVKDTLPAAQIELPGRYRNDHFMMNEQCFEMGIAIILASLVMFVVFFERSEMVKPLVNVLDQSGFIVVYVNAGGDVHGGDQCHAFFDPTLFDHGFHLGRDVDVLAMFLGVKGQVFSGYFQGYPP